MHLPRSVGVRQDVAWPSGWPIRPRGPERVGEQTPVVLINPKPGQSLRTLVDNAGGDHFRLDELTSADGAVDPLRFASTPDDGLDLAASVLLSINPWGPNKAPTRFRCSGRSSTASPPAPTPTGQALRIARAELNDP